MPLPNQRSIELPLLLELERAGGRVLKRSNFPAFYDSVAKHFPDVTPEDRRVVLRNERTPLFDNAVDWARNSLRVKGQLAGEEGVWEITPNGRQTLRTGLTRLGIAAPDTFIRSDRSIAEAAGATWQPKPRRPRARSAPPRLEPETGGVLPEGHGHAPAVTVFTPIPPIQTGTPPAAAPTIHEQLMARLLSLDPAQFEALIAEFLKRKGLSDVRVTGRSGDGGIDGEGNIAFLKLPCGFQAKRYSEGTKVSSPAINNFRGAVVGRYERGVFITTSGFTAGAKEEANEPGVTIILIDGQELVTRLLEMGMGVKTVPLVQRSVDDEFFHSLGR